MVDESKDTEDEEEKSKKKKAGEPIQMFSGSNIKYTEEKVEKKYKDMFTISIYMNVYGLKSK